MFNITLGSIQQIVNNTIRWWQAHPVAYIIVAIVMLIIAIFNMSDKKTSAGSWTIIVIAVILFMMGMFGVTGMDLGIIV